MTYEECVSHLPDKLKALGYKMVNGKMVDDVTNFYLDNYCDDCLLRIVNANEKIRQCICYAQKIHSREWKTCYYKDFNDTIYETIMDSAKNMVAQYKKYNVDLKINEISKDFV
jgi:competence protein ComGF